MGSRIKLLLGLPWLYKDQIFLKNNTPESQIKQKILLSQILTKTRYFSLETRKFYKDFMKIQWIFWKTQLDQDGLKTQTESS